MNLVLRVIGAILVVIVLVATFVVVGYTRDYPLVEAPMVEMCTAIEPGMSSVDVRAIVARFDNAKTMNSAQGIQLSQVSSDVGLLGEDWICICHVQMNDGQVSTVGEVFCVD